MFEATGWSLDDAGGRPVVRSGAQGLEIRRRFEFDHARATMSAVVFDEMAQVSSCRASRSVSPFPLWFGGRARNQTMRAVL